MISSGIAMTQLEDGGAGRVEVGDGTPDFSNARSEQLKGIVISISN